MANPNTVTANGADRRLLLVDFDWQDADLMPELLQHPGVSVRLVAGAQYDDAGIRLAELCGLPRTVDLADLTREIFDLALVSERSPRRTQIEGLLLALGTPSISPQAFLSGQHGATSAPPAEAPRAVPQPAFATAVGGADLDALMEKALPDVSGEAPQASPPAPPEPQPEMQPMAHAALPPLPAPAVVHVAPPIPPPAMVHAAPPPIPPPAAPPVSQVAPPAVFEPPPQPVKMPEPPRGVGESHAEFPGADDRRGLEAALQDLMRTTGCRRAELHVVGPDQVETVVEVGPADALLASLVGLARQLGGPQVVGGLTGQQEGKAWGAWPFRTVQRHGVIAAGGIDPVAGWIAWELAAADLRTQWDRRERELAGPAFPFLPERFPRWLDREDFGGRLELAVERNRRDGLRFHVYRLVFPGPDAVVAALCDRLPARLRDMDCLTRPTPQTVLLLTAGTAEAFVHVRRRLTSLWEDVWMESGQPKPAPTLSDEIAQLSTPADEAAFLATVRGWSARS
jgi:hypothetical protein